MSNPFIVREGGIERQGGISSGGPVLFDRSDFDSLIAEHGYLVKWEKAAFCPSRPVDGVAPMRHDVNCSLCEGKGFIYFDAKDNVVMVIQAVRLNQQFLSQGRWDVSMTLVTARPENAISWWDRITLKNGFVRWSELVRRQNGGASDVLKYAPICFDYAAWVDRTGALVTFRSDVDFFVNGNRLTWAGVGGPDADSYYTVVYRFRPRYVLQEMVHQHRDQVDQQDGARKPFPVQAVAKLDFLIRDESRDLPEAVDTSPFELRR